MPVDEQPKIGEDRIIDGFAKTRHTRESGYPGFIKVVEIPGFPFSGE